MSNVLLISDNKWHRHNTDVTCSGLSVSHRQTLKVFERGENLLRNGVYYTFVFRFSQSSGITLES